MPVVSRKLLSLPALFAAALLTSTACGPQPADVTLSLSLAELHAIRDRVFAFNRAFPMPW